MVSKIEWLARPGTTPESWNPLQDVRKGKSGRGYHCTKVSEGCKNCWAERFNKRFGNGLPFDGTSTDLELVGLEKPLSWRKPRTAAVQLMGDLFHDDVLDGFIYQIWLTMMKAASHTFIVLTKRPERMQEWVKRFYGYAPSQAYIAPNIWLGVTAENQKRADERVPLLLQTPAAVRFVSCEPLLGRITLKPQWQYYNCATPGQNDWDGLDWVIAGGESGPGARPMHPEWVRGIRDQCQMADIPFHFKQWGGVGSCPNG